VAHLPLRGLSSAPAHDSAHPSKRLLPLAEVLRRVPVSRASIYSLVAKGAFPKPLKVGSRSAWLESEVDQWVDALAAERDEAA
jgi:prophage regulatory protein